MGVGIQGKGGGGYHGGGGWAWQPWTIHRHHPGLRAAAAQSTKPSTWELHGLAEARSAMRELPKPPSAANHLRGGQNHLEACLGGEDGRGLHPRVTTTPTHAASAPGRSAGALSNSWRGESGNDWWWRALGGKNSLRLTTHKREVERLRTRVGQGCQPTPRYREKYEKYAIPPTLPGKSSGTRT